MENCPVYNGSRLVIACASTRIDRSCCCIAVLLLRSGPVAAQVASRSCFSQNANTNLRLSLLSWLCYYFCCGSRCCCCCCLQLLPLPSLLPPACVAAAALLMISLAFQP